MSGQDGGRAELSMGRVIGGGVLLLVVALLLLQIAGLVVDEEVESWEVEAPAVIEPTPGGTGVVKVRGIETQSVRIEVDGEVFHDGRLVAGESVETAPARQIAVDLPDLTRSLVIYNGSRVQPLGKLTAGRRLVFIDDVGN